MAAPPAVTPARAVPFGSPCNPDPTFASPHPRLFDLAYRLLGSRNDAEDVLQEAWLHWQSGDRAAIGARPASAPRRAAYDVLSAHFHGHGISALNMGMAIINAWNRLGVGLQPALP